MEGCKSRMVQVHKPHYALSTELILRLLHEAEMRIEAVMSFEEMHDWTIFSPYFIACYCLSLRDNEEFLLDLKTIITHKREDTD